MAQSTSESLVEPIKMTDTTTSHASVWRAFKDHCQQGHLAYQVSTSGQVVFYPRVCAPQTGEALHWELSQGLGTVYSCTEVFVKDVPSYNVSLIDVDEGFRMMSRVESIAPQDVRIGMRVELKMDTTHPDDPLPVFVPLGTTVREASHD